MFSKISMVNSDSSIFSDMIFYTHSSYCGAEHPFNPENHFILQTYLYSCRHQLHSLFQFSDMSIISAANDLEAFLNNTTKITWKHIFGSGTLH